MKTSRFGRVALLLLAVFSLLGLSACVEEPPAPNPDPDPEPTLPAEITTNIPVVDLDPNVTTTVTVTGTGFDTAGGVSNLPYTPLPGLPTGVFVVYGAFADDWRPSEDAPSSARAIIERLWAVPQTSYDFAQSDTQFWTPELRSELVLLDENGNFEVDLDISYQEASNPNFGIATYGGGFVTKADEELFIPVTFDLDLLEPEPAGPALSADIDLTNLDPNVTTTVTITGTNFDTVGGPGTRPPLPGLPTGIYLVFGSVDDNWRPSQNAGGSTRDVHFQRWPVPQVSYDFAQTSDFWNEGTLAQLVLMDENGNFSVDIEITNGDFAHENIGIFSYGAGGVNKADEELFIPVTFADDSEPTGPTLSADIDLTNLDPNATTTVTITGTGFDPAGELGNRPPLSGLPTGVYLAYGATADVWRPSEGAGGSAREVAFQRWPLPQVSYDFAMTSPLFNSSRDQVVLMDENGNFTAELEITLKDFDNPNIGIYAYGAGGPIKASQEVFIPVTFAAPAA